MPEDLGRPALPGSKSHAQRALVLAGFLPGQRVLRGAPPSGDVDVLVRALGALGARSERRECGDLSVDGDTGPGAPHAVLDLGENGTALRLLGAVLPLLGRRAALDGSPGLRRRPLGSLCEFLRAGGARADSDRLPLVVDGRGVDWPSWLCADGSLTTQVASGALLGMALRRLRHEPGPRALTVRRPAAPAYVLLTARVIEQFGCPVRRAGEGPDLELYLDGPLGPVPDSYRVPPDASAAAFPTALAAMHGRSWDDAPDADGDPHPDWRIADDVRALREAAPGAPIELTEIGRRPDCFPALAVLAACRTGATRITGAPALRAKESDRISAMARGLRAAGAEVVELPDGLVVRGPLSGAANAPAAGPAEGPAEGPTELPAEPDHRVVMALALLGTVLPGGIALGCPDAVRKSWPGFWDWLARVAEVSLDRA